MIKKIFVLLFLTLSAFSLLNAADSSMAFTRYGAFFNFRLNNHYADFKKLPNVPNCCPKFESGNGTGFALGLLWELQLPFRLHLGLKGGYSTFDASLKASESVQLKIDNDIVSGAFEHVIETKISDIFAEPYITYNPIGGFELYGGMHLGFYASKKYKQYEHITVPEDRGVFMETNTRYRNEYSGTIKDSVKMYQGLIFGMNYHLPLNINKTFFLVPDISYIYGATDITGKLKWKANSMQIGLALKYVPKPTKKAKIIYELEIQREKIDTISMLSDDITRRKVTKGIERTTKQVKKTSDSIFTISFTNRTDTMKLPASPQIELSANTPLIYLKTQYVSQVFPLLPVIFFEHKSSVIGAEYKQGASINEFSIENISPSPLELHKDILNIIGSRLKANEKANLILKGYADSSTEGADCELGLERAKSVRSYLNEVWGIALNRIVTIKATRNCSPPDPTQTKSESGYAENRRLEMDSDHSDILAPISKKKFLEVRNLTPGELIISPKVKFGNNIASWSLTAKQADKVFFTEMKSGSLKEYNRKLTVADVNQMDNSLPLNIEVKALDYEGKEYLSGISVKVLKDTADIEIQRLSLILFGVNSDLLTEKSKTALKTFMKTSIEYKKLRITGYSDILGIEEKNLQLSSRRAKNTADFIRTLSYDIPLDEVSGVGSIELPPGLDSYSSPSERFLSRTVYIELEKTLE